MERPEIPEQYRTRWEFLERELAIAAERLNEANIQYNRVILARISLRELIRKETGE